MIEKDPGNPKLFRLRVIHLYECDFNLLLGLYFRLLQQHCEDSDLLNKGSYDGRPNRRAIDPVLVDVTQTEIAMIIRRSLIRFNNDLQQCFDRILSHLATVNIQSYGIPAELAALLGEFLELAKYFIKTGIGVSARSYHHTKEVLKRGKGALVVCTSGV